MMRKLPRGVYEKLPGSGILWIRYADSTGKIRREKAGMLGAAKQLLAKRKTEILQGRKLPETMRGRTVGFAELAQDALAYSKSHKRSYDDDVTRMGRILNWFRERAADSIASHEIEQKLSQAVEESEWAPATANRYRALVSLIYSLGIRNGKVKENPARLVRHRTENNARIRFLSAEEEIRLRAVIRETCPEHEQEFEIALNTGLRMSEMYCLTWDNVDLLRRVVTVECSKNGHTRHVPLNSLAVAAFETLHQDCDGTGHVFRNARGARLTGPRYWFEPALEKARIRNFTWHCLRHTFASRLTMNGEGIRAVQDLMGHRQISMTVRYAHLAPQHQLSAVERLAASSPVVPPESLTDTKTSTKAIEQAQQERSYVH